MILAQPQIAFAPAEPNVNSSIEQKRADRKHTHLLLAEARPKMSSRPSSFLKSRNAFRPASTASCSSIAQRTLLRNYCVDEVSYEAV
jgi:hypothetical protein